MDTPPPGNPDAVVVGLDPNLTYLRLVVASTSIRAGAHFIATDRDPVYPSERGLRPGAGRWSSPLEAATGVVPDSIGKPARTCSSRRPMPWPRAARGHHDRRRDPDRPRRGTGSSARAAS